MNLKATRNVYYYYGARPEALNIVYLICVLRYGERVDYDQRHPLLRTLTIPATSLHTHNLEILIQAVPPDHEADIRPLHEYLTPCLEIAGSSAARYSVVRYPVHKTLVFSEGLQGLSTYTAIVSAKGVEKELIKGVINTPWSGLRPVDGSDAVVAVNVERAEAAIQTFRKSLGNAVEYEHAWFDSGLPPLSSWLLEGDQPTSDFVKPVVHRLIDSLLSATEVRIIAEETERLQKTTLTAIGPATRMSLSKLLSIWSENAHTELRDQLELAFDSPGWRKLAWWKLPWRVDDVAMITADILHRSWLTSAEKELIWVAGRVEQAGLYTPQPTIIPSTEVAEKDADGEPMQVRQAAILSASVPEATTETIFPRSTVSEYGFPLSTTPKPYPQGLALARHALASTTAPSLQAISQRLLLYSLSTTFLASTLSILMYISISTTSVYEAGTIAALGLVYSMRRLQKRWEDVRVLWKEGIREQGRTVLRTIERRWSDLIREGGKHETDDASLGERQKAREAMARVRSALSAMGQNG